ncbi:MAG: anaerobic ribonucleoside-triphosphate reductase [Nanoarchaeota archaeon]|nr:anaerobic ribonucleoside-triphosphate reductase [Nanoarchaeota archaeon]MBU4308693.1 anaerobic ribonucleoside-triphosphate reductase [Nanoarchaeota archaeon]
MTERTKCQRVTRCVGYFRPIDQMNEGKQEEVNDRVMFEVGTCQ